VSIKDDVNYVKKELSGDEKVLESAFKLETLYKKHKFKLWGVAIALVVFFGGRAIQETMHEAQLEKANEAFLVLQKNPTDETSFKILEENNPALLELFFYSQAVKNQDAKTLKTLSSSKNEIIADASAYTAGVLTKKPVDSVLYNEMALFEEAYVAIGAGDVKTAKAKLERIDERSPLAVITGFLKHSMIKAN
jgi:outer membrane protein assembly factor BamD (BamD/ComL family)